MSWAVTDTPWRPPPGPAPLLPASRPLTSRQRRVGQQAHVALPRRAHLGQVGLKGAAHQQGVGVLDGHDARQAQLLGGLHGAAGRQAGGQAVS